MLFGDNIVGTTDTLVSKQSNNESTNGLVSTSSVQSPNTLFAAPMFRHVVLLLISLESSCMLFGNSHEGTIGLCVRSLQKYGQN